MWFRRNQRPGRRADKAFRASLLALEERLALSSDVYGAGSAMLAVIVEPLGEGDHDDHDHDHEAEWQGALADLLGTTEFATTTRSGTTTTTTVAGASLPIPALNSLPGANASIYLDFDGDYQSSWAGYTNVSTPVYDFDGNPTALSQAEIDAITSIWTTVVENYSPFQVNVTTVDPATVSGYSGRVTKIAVGGNGSWTGGSYGGIATVGGFSSSSATSPARGFVFTDNLGASNAWNAAQATSHEAGHTFGLRHQSSYSGTTKTAEYQSGPGDGTAPIMGVSYSAQRGMWWYGTNSSGSTSYQNDLSTLISGGLTYRTTSAASPLAVNGNAVSGSGVIKAMTQTDAWTFTTDTGAVSINVAAQARGNLYPKLQIVDSAGATVVSWVDPNGRNASWSGNLAAGTYRVIVGSHGVSNNATSTNYGFSVGTYQISGSVVTPLNLVLAPSALKATAATSGASISLAWTDNATNETGYLVERSADGGSTFTQVATLGANAAAYTDTALAAGTTYVYRVKAVNATTGASSDYSNTSSATTPAVQVTPAAPSGLTATTVTSTKIRLAWSDNSTNETGFAIERATYNKKGVLGSWSEIARTAANATGYDDNKVSSSSYYAYRIRSFNGTTYSTYAYPSTNKVQGAALPGGPMSLGAAKSSDGARRHSHGQDDSTPTPGSTNGSTQGNPNFTMVAHVRRGGHGRPGRFRR